jgi:tryptophan synthase beta chain
MVKVSYQHKPYRRMLMHTWGATVHPSPSDQTEYGRKLLAEDPDCPGSLGIAISEAIEDTVKHPNTKYSLGSVLNHVCLHQTVIGQEAIKQMELAGEEPDSIIACCGGGSNFAGLAFPFIHFGDTGETTPLLMMYTLGHKFMPPPIHAGGLRYHGMSPMVSHALKLGLMEAEAYHQTKVFEAATQFARTEGIVPAPESAHAIAAVVEEANRARETGTKRVILFTLSGHGLLDLSAYETYLSGKLQDA